MNEFNQLGSDDPAALQRQIEAEQGPPEEVGFDGRPLQPDDDHHPDEDYTDAEWYELWHPEQVRGEEDNYSEPSVEDLAQKHGLPADKLKAALDEYESTRIPSEIDQFFNPKQQSELMEQSLAELQRMSVSDLREALSNPFNARMVLGLIDTYGDRLRVDKDLGSRLNEAIGSLFVEAMGPQTALKVLGEYKQQNETKST